LASNAVTFGAIASVSPSTPFFQMRIVLPARSTQRTTSVIAPSARVVVAEGTVTVPPASIISTRSLPEGTRCT
jgi:hypothetical protein